MHQPRSRLILLFILAIASLSIVPANAQNGDPLWQPASLASRQAPGEMQPSAYVVYQLNSQRLQAAIAGAPLEFTESRSQTILALPMPDSTLADFAIWESPLMEAGLARRFPDVRTYVGQSVDNPTVTTRLSVTERGFDAIILDGSATYNIAPVEPRSADTLYIAYDWADVADSAFAEFIPEGLPVHDDHRAGTQSSAAATDQLRTLRMVASTTGEFYQANGNSDPAVLSVLVSNLNQVNAIYEQTFTARFMLVANTDDVFYSDPATDPFNEFGPQGFGQYYLNFDPNQQAVDAVIGSANYDLAILFTQQGGGGGGVGGRACNATSKAKGFVTGPGISLKTFAHEAGHLFNVSHTWGYCPTVHPGQFLANSAVEAGSGRSIMSYFGVCGPTANLSGQQHLRFHANSIQQFQDYVEAASCGDVGSTANSAPVVAAGDDIAIPLNTPFTLNGSASDATPDALTYTWDQMDAAATQDPPDVDSAPFFASEPIATDASRNFPSRAQLLTPAQEFDSYLPRSAQTLDFRLTAYDNNPGAGGVGTDDVAVQIVTETTARAPVTPFAVTSQTSATTWRTGDSHNVTWNVGGSDQPPISCLLVDIDFLPNNNGAPVNLTAGTSNDGSASITVPVGLLTTGRVRVSCASHPDHTFFNISAGEVTVNTNSYTDCAAGIVSSVANSGACTLRQAVADATAGDTIRFDPRIRGGIILLTEQIVIDKALTIGGATTSVIVDGQDTTRLFDVTADNVTLQHFSLANGNADRGSALRASGNLNVTLANMTVRHNSVQNHYSGVIYGNGSTINVSNSTISDNTGGAGLIMDGSGTLNVTGSTFSGNSGYQTAGGAIAFAGGGTLNVSNSTFSGNSAFSGGAIGGRAFWGSEGMPTITATLINNTLYDNTAIAQADQLFFYTEGDPNTVELHLTNNIIGGGSLTDCALGGATTLETNRHNLIEDGSCATGAVNNFSGDPLLAALADNGGATQTMALAAGSPAVGAADAAACAAAPVDGVDQRRAGRGAACDSGAFEYATASPNQAPDAVDDAATTDAEISVNIDVLANDSDPDNDALSVTAVGTPGDGAAVLNGSTIDYTPDTTFTGTDIFTYTLSDGALQDTATVEVTVLTVPESCVVTSLVDGDGALAIAFDAAGNLYYTGGGSNVVRKRDTAGNVTTIAGTGVAGYSGDGGPATAAQLDSPLGIVVDSSGNIYVADHYNHRIRKIDTGGTITTIAGDGTGGYGGDNGPATAAQLQRPYMMAIDSANTIFVADFWNTRIRAISSGSTISTLAGTGIAGYSGDSGPATSAQINFATGVGSDSAGNRYIADTSNHVVRKVDAGGIITTVAGNGSAGYSGDGGSALSAQLNSPRDVAVDAAGNLYIADKDNHAIRMVDTSGTITTLIGTGAAGYNGDGLDPAVTQISSPYSVAVDSAGNVYVPDVGNGRIRKVTCGSNAAPEAIDDLASTEHNTPVTIDVLANDSDPDGDLLSITKTGAPADGAVLLNGTTFDYTPDAGFSGTDTFTYTVSDGDLDDTATVTVSVEPLGVCIIDTYAGTGTADYSGDDGPAGAAAVNTPFDVAVDSSGNTYIADYNNHVVRKVDSSGNISTFAGTGTAGNSGDAGQATAAQLFYPISVAVDADDNVYIVVQFGHRVRKVDGTTGVITTFAGNGTRGFSGDGGAATSARLDNPQGIAVDTAGNVYIADSLNHAIRKVDTGGTISTVAGIGDSVGYSGDGFAATGAQLRTPTGVAVDDSGNIFIADFYNRVVRKVNSAGIITTFAGTGSSGSFGDGGPATSTLLGNPSGVAVDALGNVYFTDKSDNRIRKVNGAGIISIVAGSGSRGYGGDGGPAVDGRLYWPRGIEVDAAGNVYIADEGNDRIRKVTCPAPAGDATVIHVDANAGSRATGDSWATAYTNLQDALAAAGSGDMIYVAKGIYYPDIGSGISADDATASFNIPAGVALYGGFDPANGIDEPAERDPQRYPTVLSGDIDQNDTTTTDGIVVTADDISGNNSVHVVTLDGQGTPIESDTLIDGVVITGGQADAAFPDDSAGGLMCDGRSGGTCSPTLTNINFIGNWAQGNAGGMMADALFGGTSAPTLTNVRFSGNHTQGNGGALFNRGGVDGNSTPTLQGVVFSGNSADNAGGAIYNEGQNGGNGSPKLINVLFSGNTARSAGAMANDGSNNGNSSPIVTNATYGGNRATDEGGAIASYGGVNLTMSNVIIWGNDASVGPAIYTNNSAITVRHSVIAGGSAGVVAAGSSTINYAASNTAGDPLFISPVNAALAPTTNGNLRVQAGSSAVDRGLNSALPADVVTDLDGNYRIANGTVDAGAYEFDNAQATVHNWQEGFSLPGTNNAIFDAAFDGAGNYYIGGQFSAVDGILVNRLAMYDGFQWSDVGGGLNNSVTAIAFDGDGNLYVGGTFSSAGGVAANRIAMWDGQTWSPLGGGLNNWVNALAFDSAGNLYVGGRFTDAGGDSNGDYIAMWDGNSWSAVGSGVSAEVKSIAVDSADNVYAGGAFSLAGGNAASRVAVWDGNSWSALGSGVDNEVRALALDASDHLYVGGRFLNAGGSSAWRIAKWDGAGWSAFGSGANNSVNSLVFDAAGTLYAGGEFTAIDGVSASRTASWDGNSWSALGTGTNGAVNAIALYETVNRAATANNLYAAGFFASAGGAPALNVAHWNGANWSPLSGGMAGSSRSLAADQDGNIYAAGGNPTLVMRWDGSTWHEIARMAFGVSVLQVDNDGNLYAGGDFTSINGQALSGKGLAMWDGQTWTEVGGGIYTGQVYAITFDEDNNVFIGGSFDRIGATLGYGNLAKWDGQAWHQIGAANSFVTDLEFAQNGDLYVSGNFLTVDGVAARGLAKWDGVDWSNVGGSLNQQATSLAFDGDGNLYVGGVFTQAGPLSVGYLAKWDGQAWSNIGDASNWIYALATDANGDLFAGGQFTSVGGQLAIRIARYDGSQWHALDSGVDANVRALLADGVSIYAAGDFSIAGGIVSAYVGRYGLGEPTTQETVVTEGEPAALTAGDDNGRQIDVSIGANSLPPGSPPTTVTLAKTSTATQAPNNFMFAGVSFVINAFQNGERQENFAFNPADPPQITLTYNDDDVGGLDEALLNLYYYDAATGLWRSDGITVINRDPANNSIVVAIEHLTEFALFGPATVPLAVGANVLTAHAATASAVAVPLALLLGTLAAHVVRTWRSRR